MALNLGELVATLRIDDSQVPRGLAGFAAKMAQANRQATAEGERVGKSLSAGVTKGAQDSEQAAGRVSRAVRKASAEVKAARGDEAEAAEKVRVAEYRLNLVQASGKATKSDLIRATDRVTRAQRDLSQASARTAAASKNLARSEMEGADAARKAAAAHVTLRQRVTDTKDTFTTLGPIAAGGIGSIRGAAAGGVLALGALGSAGLAVGLSTASGMEQARISFTTMLGSAQAADAFLRDLAKFAATTPFEFPELQEAASSLISAGIEANKVIPIMTTLGDVTSGMGTGSEGVQRATVALQQMSAAGRITGEDLNQLRDAGIPVFDLLAAATGKTKAEVSALAQAGKLGKTELEAMMRALETGAGLEKFNGLMEKQSQSLEGMASTLKDTFGQGMAEAIAPSLPIIKDGLGDAIQFVSDIMPEVSDGLSSMAAGLNAVAPLAEALAGIAANVLLPALGGIASLLGGTIFANSTTATVALGALAAVMAARGIAGFSGRILEGVNALGSLSGAAGTAATRVGMASLSAGRFASFLGGPWGIAIGIGVTAIVGLAMAHKQAADKAKEFTDTLTFQNGVLDENSRKATAEKLAKEGTLSAALKAGVSEKEYTDALLAGGPARDELILKLRRIQEEHTAVTQAGTGVIVSQDGVGKAAKSAADELGAMGSSLDKSAGEADQAATALGGVSTKSAEAEAASKALKTSQEDLRTAQAKVVTETQKMIDKFTILKEGGLSTSRAADAFTESLEANATTIASNRSELDELVKSGKISSAEADRQSRAITGNSAAAIANRDSIRSQVTALDEQVKAAFKSKYWIDENGKAHGNLKDAQEAASRALKTGRERILDSAEAAGINRGKVKGMVDQMALTPSELKTRITTPGMKTAQDNVKTLQERVAELKDKSFTISGLIELSAADTVAKAMAPFLSGEVDYFGGTSKGKHDGGYTGARSTTDAVDVVHGDEWVVQSSARRRFEAKYPGMLHHINQNGDLPASGGYRNGGQVARSITALTGTTQPPQMSAATSAASVIAQGASAQIVKAFTESLAKAYNASAIDGISGAFGSAQPGKYGDARFSAEQLGNAAAIASAGSSMGKRAIQIGLMTAMQESTLRNLSYGDRDSVGLFQQRAPWGPLAARMNPATSAGMFFHGGRGGQRGLDDIPGWQNMDLGRAAQAVQVSAFPGAYSRWANEAAAIMAGMSKVPTTPAAGKGKGGVVWPTLGRITSTYAGHDGVDINRAGGDYGDPIYAYRSGLITHAGYGRGYGNAVFQKPDVGPGVVYGHGSQVLVRAGQRVNAGQVIARVGSTGNSTGDHLHFGAPGGTYAQAMALLRGGYLGGTGNAAYGVRGVAEDGRPELVVSPQLRKFRGGEKVYNAQQTEKILRGQEALIGGNLVMQSTGDTRRDTEDVLFALRTYSRGSR